MKKAFALFLLAFLAACASEKTETSGLELKPVSFTALQGWESDDQRAALDAFLKSCSALGKKAPETALSLMQAGTYGAWQGICARAKTVPQDKTAARAFFEAHFQPYRAQGTGLFTGYYEPTLLGAMQQGGRYQTPLFAQPGDMLTADLGAFKPSLKGQRLTGKTEEGRFVPYDARAQIAHGSLEKRAKPLLWVSDPVDAFFLEVQGSGRVRLEDGSEVRLGYAAQNGRDYVPIGRVLADRGEIERPVSMQKIRSWLAANPQKAQAVMNENPSYVFFRVLKGEGPLGAQGVPLTPLRSLAVDPAFVPLGVPVFLTSETQNRLAIAQDTGGAIKGAVRGDLFWGAGAEAAARAGTMQESGQVTLLLPKER